MSTRITITLEIEGDEQTAVDAVEYALDDGVLQDAINDYQSDDGEGVHVSSAVITFADEEGEDSDNESEG